MTAASRAFFLAISAAVALAACTPKPHAHDSHRAAAAALAPPAKTGASAVPAGAPLRCDRGVDAAPLAVLPADLPVLARFLVFGDSGIGTSEQMGVAATMRQVCQTFGCDFAAHTGDIIYPRGVLSPDDPKLHTRFEEPYAPLGIPIYLSLGNHDYYGDPDAAVAYTARSPSKRWVLPARHHTFVEGGVRFIALDTNKPDKAQEAWLRGVLAESRARREPWVIAYGHHPRQSYGAHGMADEQLAEWLDRNLCHRVDVFLAGHDHDKQLLKPRCGVVQVVSGAAGQLRPVKEGPQTVWARSSLGFAHVEVKGPELRLRFFDATGAVELDRTLVRAVADVCGADQLCNGLCRADPDCATAACAADQRCDEACTDDPDCVAPGACACDRHPLACEVRANDTTQPCGCDPACQVGRPVCVLDGACDDGCKPGTDIDCRP